MKRLLWYLLNISIIMSVLMTGMRSTVQGQTQAPAADFSANPTSGAAPLAVQFTDESTGDPTGWAWYFGGESLPDSWDFVSANADWSPRLGHACVVLANGEIVLMGGMSSLPGGDLENDVWRSNDDGLNWTAVTAKFDWSPRHGHTSVVLPDGAIILMGGWDDEHKNDVWRSDNDGVDWIEVTDNADWSARLGHASVVLSDGAIILMGGAGASGPMNDVWRSNNGGVDWIEVTDNADWSARFYHTSVILPNNDIVLMGGGYFSSWKNDIWHSMNDGSTWTLVTNNADWSARYGHTSVALPNGDIILIGGDTSGDVWRSSDGGAQWTSGPTLPSYAGPLRTRHTSVVLPNGRIILMGGYADALKNDVLQLETAGSHEQNPEHAYDQIGVYTVTLQAYNEHGVSRITKPMLINILYQQYLPLLSR